MRISLVLIAGLLLIVSAVVVLAIVQPFQDDDPPPIELSVDAVVATPPRWFREAVEVTARAVPLDDGRFILEGNEQAIVVQPKPDAVEGEVEHGERVTVRGIVYWLTPRQAAELRPLLQDDRQAQLAQAPTAPGGAYIYAQYVDATG